MENTGNREEVIKVEKDLKEKINKVITLSREEQKEYWKTRSENIKPIGQAVDMADVIDIGEDSEYSKKHKELFNYLNSLDYDTIMDIQTIMYVGRDYVGYNNMSTTEIFNEVQSSLGRGDKFAEIDQIISKAPLHKYLENGMKILKM